jgi:hypothetical protein
VPNPLSGELITIYNLNPAKQGLVDLLDTTADNSQARTTFNGFDVGFSARLPQGGSLFGGWSAGKAVFVTCADLSNPNTLLNCDQSLLDIPYRHSFKINGSYPLPLGFMVGATMVSNPGAVLGNALADPSLATTWSVPTSVFPNAQRTQSVSVRLDVPQTEFLERWNQLDLNIRRVFRIGTTEIEPGVDIYNIFNSNVVLQQIQSFGSSLGTPQRILQGRLMRLTASVDF